MGQELFRLLLCPQHLVPCLEKAHMCVCSQERSKWMHPTTKKNVTVRERENELIPVQVFCPSLKTLILNTRSTLDYLGSQSREAPHKIKYIKTKTSCFPERCQVLCFALYTHYLSYESAQPYKAQPYKAEILVPPFHRWGSQSLERLSHLWRKSPQITIRITLDFLC